MNILRNRWLWRVVYSLLTHCRSGWRRTVCILVLVLVGAFSLLAHEFLLSAVHLYNGSISQRDVSVDSCPACFGLDFCQYLDGFKRRPEFGTLFVGNMKGVHVGQLTGRALRKYPNLASSPLVTKSLAFDWELNRLNADVCQEAVSYQLFKGQCNTASVSVSNVRRLAVLTAGHLLTNLSLFYNVSDHYAPSLSQCAGPILHKTLSKAYDSNHDGTLSPEEAAFLRTGLMVNSEVAILKAFPSEDGWPFPSYFGACGRMIFVEDGGEELTEFLNRPWRERALVSQALVTAILRLTDNKQGWTFHLLDSSFGNFAAQPNTLSGRGYIVKLIDAESVIAVNQQDLSYRDGMTTGNVEVSLHTDMTVCPAKVIECLVFFIPQLCAGGHHDMNYLYTCRNLLMAGFQLSANSENSDNSEGSAAQGRLISWKGGLLSNPPDKLEKQLRHLLDDCLFDRSEGRRKTIQRIYDLLNVD